MRRSGNPSFYLLLAACVMLLSAILACTITFPDLPGLSSDSDETKMAEHIQASLTAVIATEQFNLTETAIRAPSATPTPLPTDTPTITPSPTPSMIPTETLTPTPEGVFISPIVFASKVDNDANPIDGAKRFKKGIVTIYATFTYSGMEDGMSITYRWELNGKEWSSSAKEWEYGPTGNHWSRTYYVEPNKALPSGTYTFYFYVEGELMQSGSVIIYE